MKTNRIRHYQKSAAFVAHFRFLGLKRGECRAHVIRSAAEAMSIALTHNGDQIASPVVEDGQRALIAIATYRLLDPRERCDLYERVQLTYPLDREEAEVGIVDSQVLISQMPDPVDIKVKLMEQPVIGQAIEGQAATESVDTELSMDERRGIVRLLRESDEANLRGLSPLGWLRSRLGI